MHWFATSAQAYKKEANFHSVLTLLSHVCCNILHTSAWELEPHTASTSMLQIMLLDVTCHRSLGRSCTVLYR